MPSSFDASTFPPHTAGVICEFNPLHNGHIRLLSAMRSAVGPDGCVICLMSGRFVQRGEPALADPYLRARMVLDSHSADVVLELPFPWSAAGAEFFASAGVFILHRLGVEQLAFGSETGTLSLLSDAAQLLESDTFRETCAALVKSGSGTTAAYIKALRDGMVTGLPDGSRLPDNFPSSNDILAIQYLRAITRFHARMEPLVVLREGQAFRDHLLHDPNAPSASALRPLIQEAAEDPECLENMLTGTMPPEALDVLLSAISDQQVPVRGEALLPYFHVLCRMSDSARLDGIAELSGGLADRMIRTARKTGTPEAFMQELHTRLYPDARLRRGMLFAATQVMTQDLLRMPEYVMLLGATSTGCRWLRDVQRTCDFPIVTKPSDAPTGWQTALAAQADALFTLCLPRPLGTGEWLRKRPYIV